MFAWKPVVLAAAIGVVANPSLAGGIKKADLSRGYEEGSVVSRPVLDTSGVGPIQIVPFREAYDKDQFVFRSTTSVWKGGGGVKAKIDAQLDLGKLFADALRAEAPKLGFSTGPGGWKLGGEILEIYVDSMPASRFTGFSAMLWYASMTVKFELESPSGARSESTQRLLGYFVGGSYLPNVLSRQMVFAAQDALARLNAGTFKAPPHAGVARMIEELKAKPVEDAKDVVRMIGLSGSPEAVAPLLEKLAIEEDAGDRSFLVEALAALGRSEPLEALASRYAGEDEDNRLATLKVYEYVGTPDARRLAGAAFENEPSAYLKRLAREVADGASVRGPLPEK